jgi:hypothetical protein
MLTHLDETPWHQTSETFDHVATSDPRFFDRFWFAATDPSGTGTCQFTIGVYQNMNVVDGGFVVIHDGRQHNLRASRQLRPDYQIGCGPLGLEVVKPMETLAITIDPNPSGITGKLTWHATGEAQDERPHFSRSRGRVIEDYSRYDQIGRLTGSIDLGGTLLAVDDWWSCRDHSWGVRPGIGIPEPETGRSPQHRSFVFAFLFFSTDTCVGHAQLSRRADASHMTAELRDLVSGQVQEGTAIDLRANFVDAARPRRVRSATFNLSTGTDTPTVIDVEAVGPAVAMAGLGYIGYDDGRGLGVYRGPEHLEHDIWDVTDPATVGLGDGTTTRPLHRIQPVRVILHGPDGPRTGLGSLTMIAEDDVDTDGALRISCRV